MARAQVKALLVTEPVSIFTGRFRSSRIRKFIACKNQKNSNSNEDSYHRKGRMFLADLDPAGNQVINQHGLPTDQTRSR